MAVGHALSGRLVWVLSLKIVVSWGGSLTES